MSLAIEPFTVDIPEADLVDLRERLTRARLSQQLPDPGWECGPEPGSPAALRAYWRAEYDWRRAEATLNSFDHFLAEIDGTRVHFLHARSPEPDAFPLVITHGWPGSIVEFLERIRARRLCVRPTRPTSCSRPSPATRSRVRRPNEGGDRAGSPKPGPR